MDEDITHYMIGSSIFVTLYPLVYLTFAHNKLSDEEKENLRVSLPTVCLMIPILFGLLFTITYRIITFVPRSTSGGLYLRFVVAGAVASLLLSLIAHYGFNIQTDWLHMENPHVSHMFIPIFYFVLFYTVGLWFRAMLRYGTAKPITSGKPTTSPSPNITTTLPIPKTPKLTIPKGIPSDKSSKVFDRLATK
jgi:hypothetical protein